MVVTYEAIRKWCRKFGPHYANQLRRRRPPISLPCDGSGINKLTTPGTPVAGARWGPYNPGMAFVYILQCSDGSLYTGITTNMSKRLKQHQAGQASKYTRAHLPVTLCWTRQVYSWSEALKEEHRIKGLTRTQKEAFVKAAQDLGPATP